MTSLHRFPHSHIVKRFEEDPTTQLKFHLFFSFLWLVNIVVAVFTYLALPAVWSHYSVLYLVVVSLYANFATDYGAVAASIAARDIAKTNLTVVVTDESI